MGKKIHQIPKTGDAADLNNSTYIAVDSSANGTKKLPANLLATKSVQDNLSGSIAPLFSESKSYAVGDPVMDTDGKLYRCTVAHSAGAWNSDHFVLDTATKRTKNLATAITEFRNDDVIAVDGPTGTAKMSKDTLLSLTAQNALAGNVAPDFVPNSTNAEAGKFYTYEGVLYEALENYNGIFEPSKFENVPLSKFLENFNSEIGVIENVKYDTFSGYLLTTGEIQTADATKQQVVTEFIEATEGDLFNISLEYTTSHPVWIGIGIYGDTQTITSRVVLANDATSLKRKSVSYVVPSGVSRVRFCYATYGDASVTIKQATSLQNLKSSILSKVLFTPFELGVKQGECGYLTRESGAISRTINLSRAIFGFISVGKGTEISIEQIGSNGNPDIKGLEIVEYDETTGEYITTIGNVSTNLLPVVSDRDCVVIIQVNTTAEDVSGYLSDIEQRIKIALVPPAKMPASQYPCEFEQGTLSAGTPTTSTTRIRTSDFVLMGKGSVIQNYNLSQLYVIALYDVDTREYLQSFPSNGFRSLPSYQLDNDYYVKVVGLNAAGGDILPAAASFNLVKHDVSGTLIKPYKTPFELGVKHGEYGYFVPVSGALNRTLVQSRALFGWLHLGKGSIVTIDLSTFGTDYSITSLQVCLYNERTGAYIEAIGNLSGNKNPLTIPYDCIAAVYVNTSATDISSNLADVEKRIKIKALDAALRFTSFPCGYERGSLSAGSGAPMEHERRMRSDRFVLLGKGSVIFYNSLTNPFGAMMYSTKDKGYMKEFSVLQLLPCVQLTDDAYVKIQASPKDGEPALTEDDMTISVFAAVPSGSRLPDYYYEDDYIQGVADEISSHDSDCSGTNGDLFAFITDVHWATNWKKSPQLLDWLAGNTSLRNVFFGGDAITKYDTKAEAKAEYDKFRDTLSNFKSFAWRPVIGNHEFNNPGATQAQMPETLSASEAFALVYGENENIINVIDDYAYYIDNKTAKIRYIFVGASYTSLIPVSVQNDVISALDALPAGYQVLVISHVGLVAVSGSLTIDLSFQSIVDKLDSMQANENVIGVLSGHQHVDGAVTTSAGTNVIATTSDGYVEHSSSQLTRTYGTITEQAFDVVQIDKANRKIYLTRVGAGEDREFDY